MRRFPIFTAVLLLVVSCTSGPSDPVAEAIEAYLIQLSGSENARFTLYKLDKIDSTTIGTELERRQKVLMLKSSRESELYSKYNSQGMRTNANLHMEALTKANRSLHSLDSLWEVLSSRLNETAYCDYHFQGKLTDRDSGDESFDAYFTITPAMEILTISNDPKDIHKNAGRAIPGYLEIFGRNEDDD